MDHTVLPAITPMPGLTSKLAFIRRRFPRLRLRTSTGSLLLIYLPRKDERLSRPDWLTYSGRFTHIGHPSAAGRTQDRGSSPVKDQHSTTVLRNQPKLCYTFIIARQPAHWRAILIYQICLSVRLLVCLSDRDVPVLDENGLTYRDSFFSPYGIPIILV